MATQVQLRRGTTTEHASFTGAVGEVTVDITKDTLVVHDGATAGGYPLARESDLSTMGGTMQPLDADLTAIAALSGTSGFLTKVAADTWSLDTSTYLTGNQSITFSGDVTGSGTTSVTLTLASGAVTTAKIATGVGLTDPVITGCILEDIFTITDGAAFEVDPSNGSVQLITLGASRTPKATNFAAGESVTLMVDDGSAYTLTWSDTTWGAGGVTWVGGSAPTLATSGYTVIQLWKVGTQVYGFRVGDVA